MHTAMVIAPHADDAALFCGGALAKFASEGWRIVLVRVTDDRTDSADLTYDETIRRNTEELQRAAAIMGIADIEALGYRTDQLADESETALRERFIYLFRKHRPYAVFTFDPDGRGEENMDHVVVSHAVDEAFWTAKFHLHHPEHVEAGHAPFAVCERWYFARQLSEVNHVEDITEHFETKVAAVCAHETMVRHMIQQHRMHLETWGRRVAMLDAAQDGDLEPVVRLMLEGQAREIARHAGLAEGRLAEAYRLVRFGAFENLFQQMAEPIPGAPEPPKRPSLGDR